MPRLDILKKQQALLRKEVTAHLYSFLIGTVAKSPSMSGHNLTTKMENKAITLHKKGHCSESLRNGQGVIQTFTETGVALADHTR